VTDSLGRFRLAVPSGEAVVRAQMIGYDTDFQLCRWGNKTPLRSCASGRDEAALDGTDWPLPENPSAGTRANSFRTCSQWMS